MTTPSITQLYWITIACERFGNIASAWTGFFGCRLTFDLLFCIERNWECGLMIWWNLISSQIFFVPWIGSATQLRKEEFLHWIVCTSLPQAALRSVVSGTSASLVPARWVPSRCFWAYFDARSSLARWNLFWIHCFCFFNFWLNFSTPLRVYTKKFQVDNSSREVGEYLE